MYRGGEIPTIPLDKSHPENTDVEVREVKVKFRKQSPSVKKESCTFPSSHLSSLYLLSKQLNSQQNEV